MLGSLVAVVRVAVGALNFDLHAYAGVGEISVTVYSS